MALSPTTHKIYNHIWLDFTEWCATRKRDPLPARPATIARYLRHRAKSAGLAAVAQRLSAIASQHRQRGMPFNTKAPAIQTVMADIRIAAQRPVGSSSLDSQQSPSQRQKNHVDKIVRDRIDIGTTTR